MGHSKLKTSWRPADPVGLVALVSIVLAALIAYHNSFTVPFIFDDSGSIVENHTIRQLWPQHLTLPDELRGATVDGRPFLNFTFAVNYALGELNPQGYHALNLFIHILAALTIFGLVRRLASRAPRGSPLRDAALWLALTTALLWVVHPLQTQAVTYTVQRAESLASLLYLLVLYSLLRSYNSAKPYYWLATAFLACLLGVATKEIVATAPLASLLFDRTFLSKSYAELYERRKWFHASLWSTLVLLGWLMHSTGGRDNTAGFGVALPPLVYLQTQIWAIPHYLSLAFYPSPLIILYGDKPVTGLANLLLPGIILLALLSATIWAIVGKHKIAFPAALFFLVLAPTSSFVPITDPVFEHRMYLPLACVAVISVLFAFGCWERMKPEIPDGLVKRLLPPAAIALAVSSLTLATIDRNRVYTDPINLWKDAISKVPDNGRAYTLLGTEYNKQGRSAEAIAAFETALSLVPDDFRVLNNLALAYQLVGEREKAQAVSKRLLALNPDNSKFKVTQGMLLLENGKTDEALQLLSEAEAERPGDAILINRIGYALLLQGKSSEALPYFERAISMRPDVLEMHFNFGQALMATGQPERAARAFEEELRLSPQDLQAWMNLGASLVETGNDTVALNAFERAIALEPADVAARLNASSILIRMEKFAAALEHIGRAEAAAPPNAGIYGNKGAALLGLGKTDEALRAFRKAIEINPEDGETHANMGMALLSLGRQRESLEYLRAAVKLLPGKPALHNYLGKALLETGQAAQASEEFTMALKLDPYFTEARQGLQSANAARTGNTRSTRQ